VKLHNGDLQNVVVTRGGNGSLCLTGIAAEECKGWVENEQQ